MSEKLSRPTYLIPRSNGEIVPMEPTGARAAARGEERSKVTTTYFDPNDINPETGKPKKWRDSKWVNDEVFTDETQDTLAQQLAEASPTYAERMAEIERQKQEARLGGKALEVVNHDPTDDTADLEADSFAHLWNTGPEADDFDVERAAVREPIDPAAAASELRRRMDTKYNEVMQYTGGDRFAAQAAADRVWISGKSRGGL